MKTSTNVLYFQQIQTIKMSKNQQSFSIVDDDDDDVFDMDNIDDGEVSTLDPNTSAMHRTPQMNREYESSDESNLNSPVKKMHVSPLEATLTEMPNAGPSNGRQTVTKIRAPPQLIHISSDSESDDSEIHRSKKNKRSMPGEYDAKMYDDLDVSNDVRELFQYITKYVPQQLGQDYKFKPFIPDFIPAVGDIDAFLKVIPPETGINGELPILDQSDLGLAVLDEPAANQSDPAVLHLQLRASSVKMSQTTDMVIKKVDNIEKNSKIIDKWIKDISDLHKSKSSPILKYSNSMPDLDDLMEEWPENMENLLKIHGFPSYTMKGPLSRYIDVVCCLFNIPVYKNKIESLHLLFSLYAAVKTSHLYRAANSASRNRNTPSANMNESNNADQLVLD